MGWRLFEHGAQQGRTIGYLDIDQLAMSGPPASAPGAATHVKAANLAAVLPHYWAAGAEQIVVTGVATPVEVPVFEEAVGAVRWVRLTAARAELHRRVTHRDGSAVLLPEIDRHADELDASTFATMAIDTSTTAPSDIARQIEAASPPAEPRGTGTQGSPSPPIRRPNGAGGRSVQVVVITGPRAVGVSTVGWEVFTRGQAEEEPTAFIDLAQIGFLNAGPDGRARHHRLRAANLAAMVEVYEGVGCQRVIAGGAVLSAAEWELYADALAGRSLSVIQLTGTPGVLRQRVAARSTATGGPHLAGDDLRGQTGAALAPVVEQALLEAAQLRLSDFADQVIDTSHLSVRLTADMVQRIIAREQ